MIGSLSETETCLAKKLTNEHNSDNQKEVRTVGLTSTVHFLYSISLYKTGQDFYRKPCMTENLNKNNINV